jgi:ribonuclease HI
MELRAAIEALRALKCACRVTALTDSEYLRRGITEFLSRWKENGWRNSAGEAVANQDRWEQLEELVQYHDVNWLHVSGHSGDADQDRCDALATAAAKKMKTCATRGDPGGT